MSSSAMSTVESSMGGSLVAALDAREREDGVLARRGTTKQAGFLPMGVAKLAINASVEGRRDGRMNDEDEGRGTKDEVKDE
jgi:hypothetical protein